MPSSHVLLSGTASGGTIIDSVFAIANQLGYSIESFKLSDGWYATVSAPGQSYAIGVAVKEVSESQAVAAAMDDALHPKK